MIDESAGPFILPELPPAVAPRRAAEEDPRPGRRRARRGPGWAPANRTRPARAADAVLRWGPVLLLLGTPLAWGSVQPWSEALLVAGAALLGALWVLRLAADPAATAAERAATSRLLGWSAGLHGPVAAVLLLALLQLLPLGGLAGAVSPVSAELYRLAGSRAARLSVAPAETLRAAAEMAALALLFFAVLDSLRGRAEVRTLAVSLIAVGFVHAVSGTLWHLSSGWRAYGLAAGVGGFGPYVNRNHFANLMAMAIPVGFGYLVSLGHRRSPAGGAAPLGPGASLPPREREIGTRQVLAGFAVAVMAGALTLSLSRAGIVSACLGLVAFSLAAALGRRTRGRAWRAGAAAAAAAAFAVWLGGGRLLARLATLGAPFVDPSLASRAAIWDDTLRLAADYPLFGSGFGSFASVFPRYQSSFPDHAVLHAHSDWLQLAAEGGLAGTVAVLVLVGSFLAVVFRILRKRRDAEAVFLALGGVAGVLAFLAHATVEFSLHVPANALWLAVLAAWTIKAAASRG